MSDTTSPVYCSKKFTELLDDEDELIDVQRLVVLFNSVTPKLYKVLKESSEMFLAKKSAVQTELSWKNSYKASCRLILGIESVYHARYDGYMRSISSFDDVTKNFAEKLQDQICISERELLMMIFASRPMMTSVLDLLKDVDKLEEDIRSMFKELVDFLDEILTHFSSLENSPRKLASKN